MSAFRALDPSTAAAARAATLGASGCAVELEVTISSIVSACGYLALTARNRAIEASTPTTSAQGSVPRVSLANYPSSSDWCVEQAGAVGSPDEVPQIGASGCAHAAALRGCSTTERGVNAPLIVVDGISFQFAL